MNKKTYTKMVDDAINEFKDMNINYRGMIAALHLKSGHGDYINKQTAIIAHTRIETLRSLKELGLLK